MKNKLCVFFAMLILLAVSCHSGAGRDSSANSEKLINNMSPAERKSVVFSAVSPNQKYYWEVADVAEYIREMSVYDEELHGTYIIHITLPPGYDKNRSYPMYMMTDGIWRLSDHAELRPMMVNGEIEDIIMVSIGYDYGIDAEKVETRMVEFVWQSDRFLNFITENLVPYLGELYNIDYKRSALMGHSLGGLFMYYAVFNHDKYKNSPFHYYVMASPSLYVINNQANWKHGNIEEDYFKRNHTLEKEIYLTVGDQEYDMLPNINNFLQRAMVYGIRTIDYEEYDGDHVSFVKEMMRNSLLKFYGK
jgi:enterochelin esterase-like enzyme